MSDPSPTEPLNGGRALVSTFRVFSAEGLRLVLFAALAAFCGDGIQRLLAPLLKDQIATYPALNIAPWAAQFPTFVLGDTAIAVVALMALRGGRARVTTALLGALVLLPVCLIVDLVENLPDVLQILILGRDGGDEIRAVVTLLVAAAWNTVWFPALAVAVEERRGPIATLRRSFDLVRGNWFRTFSFVLFMQLSQQLLPYLIALTLVSLTQAEMPWWAYTAIATPFFAFASTSQATLYWELARLRDGVNRSEVNSIFD